VAKGADYEVRKAYEEGKRAMIEEQTHIKSAQIVPFEQTKVVRACSFCKKTDTNSEQFFVSNVSSHCICGDCAKKAKRRIEETNNA
jgi:hypothetical protein